MGKKIDINTIIGIKFGRLTIIKESEIKKHNRVTLKCKCDCGNEFIGTLNSIKKGNAKSCGCFKNETKSNYKNGLRKHPLYSVWANIKQRCLNKKQPKYNDYGGRGIIICKEWENSFEIFYKWCLDNNWKKGLEIDRLDNNGNYDSGNCRFVNRSQNMNNTRYNTIINYNNETKTLAEWAKELNIPYGRLAQRINKLKMPIEIAFSNQKIKRRFHKKIIY
jgi:hypothetical protein